MTDLNKLSTNHPGIVFGMACGHRCGRIYDGQEQGWEKLWTGSEETPSTRCPDCTRRVLESRGEAQRVCPCRQMDCTIDERFRKEARRVLSSTDPEPVHARLKTLIALAEAEIAYHALQIRQKAIR